MPLMISYLRIARLTSSILFSLSLTCLVFSFANADQLPARPLPAKSLAVKSLAINSAAPKISGAAKLQNPLLSQAAVQKIIPTLLQHPDAEWNRGELLRAINNSLRFMRSFDARETYGKLNDETATYGRVLCSLERFRYVLLQSETFEQFVATVGKEFELYQSPRSENDPDAQVKFTGYFQPVYKASRLRTAEFRYPIFKKPENFDSWPQTQATRVSLEGYDGLGSADSQLAGRELAYVKTRWEAFMIHVQGSAILEMKDNEKMAVGFDGATNYPFRGIPKSFMQQYNVAWQKLGDFFEKNPALLNQLMANNNRFIFFKENPFPDPIGSLGVPVIAERSIATDKSQFPPGALGLIYVSFPRLNPKTGNITLARAAQFVLDQDTGSAIKGRARVDVFMGTGKDGQKKASHLFTNGDLYYLLLKES